MYEWSLHEVPDPLDACAVVDVELVEVDGAALLHQLGHGRHAPLGAPGRQVHVALLSNSPNFFVKRIPSTFYGLTLLLVKSFY